LLSLPPSPPVSLKHCYISYIFIDFAAFVAVTVLVQSWMPLQLVMLLLLPPSPPPK